MSYLVTLLIMLVLYGGVVYLMKYFKNQRLTNLIFIALTFIPYITMCIIVYKDVGFYDWNYQNTLPVANVSPFTFTVVPLIALLPKKVKKHCYLLLSLLFLQASTLLRGLLFLRQAYTMQCNRWSLQSLPESKYVSPYSAKAL